jgi:hypothetical protein
MDLLGERGRGQQFIKRHKKAAKGNVTVTKEDVTLLAFLEEHKFSLEYFQDEYGSFLSWQVTDGNDPTWYPRVVGRGPTVKAAIEDAIKYVASK